MRTERAGSDIVDEVRRLDPHGEWVAALTHARLPCVSYPYEWPFSMLKDAALLQLRLVSEALSENLILKDSTPYNIQWRGSQPVFVDIGSFERAREGEPWAGYRQFCSLFLYPLMLEAYKGVPFQRLLRGAVDGISPPEFRALFGLRDGFRKGMLRHVFLHSNLERRNAGRTAVREELGAAGFDRRLIEANVAQLSKLVGGLQSCLDSAGWQRYRETCTYTDHDTGEKDDFVRRAVHSRRWTHVWDLGCNDGRHSRIASENSDYVVAIDSDPVVVDALYRSLESQRSQSILPLVMNLADPSPATGWRNRERVPLERRSSPALVLLLAIVHHLSITSDVPLRELVDWMRSLQCEVVVEFPDRDDPMVRRLLQAKGERAHPDYTRHEFEELLRAGFEIVDLLELPSRTRVIYHAKPT